MNHFDQLYKREPIVINKRHGGLREKHIAPALTYMQVMKMREQHRDGKLYKWLAYEYGVHRHTASDAVQGKGTYARY